MATRQQELDAMHEAEAVWRAARVVHSGAVLERKMLTAPDKAFVVLGADKWKEIWERDFATGRTEWAAFNVAMDARQVCLYRIGMILDLIGVPSAEEIEREHACQTM